METQRKAKINMLYIHENNIDTKIYNNYHGKRSELQEFKKKYYIPFRESAESIDFFKSESPLLEFKKFADLLNQYYDDASYFSRIHDISHTSKFCSTILEELSVYLFKDIPQISSGRLSIFNKGVYAGLKINDDLSLGIIKKDVDFCIGKKVNMRIENQSPTTIIVPVISVEVKTYLDATMFGEVKSSSKTLKSATPNSKAYVLMGYKDLADEHIISAKQDSTLDEMFVLRADKSEPIDYYALYIYWTEICNSIKNIVARQSFYVPGRLLSQNDLYIQLKNEYE